MIPAAFEYVRVSSVAEALKLLDEGGDDVKLLAGGHSLLPMMKLRFAAPTKLIDIGGIPLLAEIDVAGGHIVIGALATHARIAADERLHANAPALWDAANGLGDAQVRNRGTIGGSAAHADAAADYPAVLLALDATFKIAGLDGDTELRAPEFFLGMFETALDHDEVLTAIGFDAAPHSAYAKYAHPASHYAVVGAAAVLQMKGDAIASARVAVTGLGEVAFRASAVEQALVGVKPADAAALARACAGAGRGVDARSDTFASAEYRTAMADVYVERAVRAAAAR
jgi:carbon-monoxide dehydrogenase medium subunit